MKTINIRDYMPVDYSETEPPVIEPIQESFHSSDTDTDELTGIVVSEMMAEINRQVMNAIRIPPHMLGGKTSSRES